MGMIPQRNGIESRRIEGGMGQEHVKKGTCVRRGPGLPEGLVCEALALIRGHSNPLLGAFDWCGWFIHLVVVWRWVGRRRRWPCVEGSENEPYRTGTLPEFFLPVILIAGCYYHSHLTDKTSGHGSYLL